MEGKRSYFMRRAAQERSAAQRAASGRARQAHEELAERYQDMVRGRSAQETQSA